MAGSAMARQQASRTLVLCLDLGQAASLPWGSAFHLSNRQAALEGPLGLILG